MRNIRFFLFMMLLACWQSGRAQQSVQAPVQQLNSSWSAFMSDPQFRHAIASLVVRDARTGETIFSRNQDLGLATASTLKVITAASAFHLLGADYRYRTRIAHTGSIAPGGVLKGDLIIVGSGDPTLGSWRWPETGADKVLAAWVSELQAKGIKQIEGRVIGDDSRMETQTIPDGWQWNDIGNYYGAGSAGLNWRENQFDILLQPSSVGGPVRIGGTRPEMTYLHFVNELQTGRPGTGDQAYVYMPPYRDLAYLRGTYAVDQRERSISAAVPDPAFEAAFRLEQAIEKAGIAVSEPATTSRRMALNGEEPGKTTAFFGAVPSPTLVQIVKQFNDKSINLYGESLVKTIAIEKGKRGGTEAGVRLIREFWSGKGIDSASLAMVDGSGLSPDNRVTAAAMAQVLLDARQQPWFAGFYDSLPLRNGMHMKSGFISGVRSYAGYHTAASGRQYLFVFIVNNFNGSPSTVRRKMWALLDVLK